MNAHCIVIVAAIGLSRIDNCQASSLRRKVRQSVEEYPNCAKSLSKPDNGPIEEAAFADGSLADTLAAPQQLSLLAGTGHANSEISFEAADCCFKSPVQSLRIPAAD